MRLACPACKYPIVGTSPTAFWLAFLCRAIRCMTATDDTTFMADKVWKTRKSCEPKAFASQTFGRYPPHGNTPAAKGYSGLDGSVINRLLLVKPMSLNANPTALTALEPAPDFVLAPRPDWADTARCEHFVQFYEDDAFLIESVSAFIGEGLRVAEGAVVIATKAHRDALEERLRKDGLDLTALRACGQYFPLDAAETLSKFMVGGLPDAN